MTMHATSQLLLLLRIVSIFNPLKKAVVVEEASCTVA